VLTITNLGATRSRPRRDRQSTGSAILCGRVVRPRGGSGKIVAHTGDGDAFRRSPRGERKYAADFLSEIVRELENL